MVVVAPSNTSNPSGFAVTAVHTPIPISLHVHTALHSKPCSAHHRTRRNVRSLRGIWYQWTALGPLGTATSRYPPISPISTTFTPPSLRLLEACKWPGAPNLGCGDFTIFPPLRPSCASSSILGHAFFHISSLCPPLLIRLHPTVPRTRASPSHSQHTLHSTSTAASACQAPLTPTLT